MNSAACYIVSPTEWLEKYTVRDDALQRSWRIYTDYIYSGDNTRSILWGMGAPSDCISQTIDAGWKWLNGMNLDGYTPGEVFSLHFDTAGTARFKVSDVVVNRNEWNPDLKLEDLGGGKYIWSGAEGYKFRLATTHELIAQGYTQLIVTFRGNLGDALIWWGDDDWGDGEFSINAEHFVDGVCTITVDLTGAVAQLQFDEMQDVFTLMGNAASFSDIEITITPDEATKRAPLDKFTVTVPAGDGYTVSGLASVDVYSGYSASFAISANEDGKIVVVKHGETVINGINGVFTVDNITENITLTVEVIDKPKPQYPLVEGTLADIYSQDSWTTETYEGEAGYYAILSQNATLSGAFLKSLWDEGYTHLVFTAEFDTTGDFIHAGPVWNAQWVNVQAGVPTDVRFDISEFCIDGTWYGTNVINMTGGNITISNARAYKSAETLEWTKHSSSESAAPASNIYFALEDGYYVLRLPSSANYLTAPTAWVAQHLDASATVDWDVYTDYIDKGSNTRSIIWGWGTPIDCISATTDAGSYTLAGLGPYTEGMKFSIHIDMGATARFKINSVTVNDTPIIPEPPVCTEHTDANGDEKCDNCGADVPAVTPPVCTEHADANGDEKCDNCGADVPAVTPPVCTEHTDANGDEKCDNCGADVPAETPDPKPEVPTGAVGELLTSSAWSAGGTESEGKIVVPASSQIKADYLKSLWDAGYTHLVFTVNAAAGGDNAFMHGGEWDRYWRSIETNVDQVIRIDLNEFHDGDTWYSLNFSKGEMTVSNVKAYKSAETLSWTKIGAGKPSNVYFAIEDGYYVLDTISAQGVTSPTEWLEKYCVADDASQRSWRVYTDWLNKGGNTRSLLWGWGSAVNIIHSDVNGGWAWLNAVQTDGYADGEIFSLHTDLGGTARFKILDWVSNRNEWNAQQKLEYVNENTIIWSGADSYKIRLATTQDLIAQGYTKLTITVKGDLGSAILWWGDDDWGDGEFSLNANDFTEGVYTFEVDLTGAVTQLKFDSNACFTLMGNAAAFSDIEITVIPSKGTETPEPPVCTEHADANGDEKCDNCGADVPAETPDPKPEVPTGAVGELLTSSAWSAGGTESEGKIVVPASSQIKADYLKSLWDEGYTHLVFTVNAAAGGDNAFMHGGEWDRYWRGIDTNVDQVIRIDLNEFHDGDTWYSLNFSKGEMTVSNVKAYKSAETLSWTKIGAGKPSNVYFAIEDGYYVLETNTAQGVTSPTEWLEKYCVADDASQRSWRVYTDWLNKGSNTRSLLWGWGEAVNIIHSDVNGGWTWLNAVQTDGYTDGEIFSLHTDLGGTARFKILDWVSNRNEWNAQQKLEYVNENTIIWSGADSYKIRLATTQDLIAQGYTKLTITVKGDLGSAIIWYGNDDWNNDGGEYNFTADSFADGVFTIEVDLTATEGPFRLNNGECITFMGNAAAFTDLEITAVPSK